MPYKQAEAVASILWCWSPTLVPGLLQCELYARALFDIEGHSLSRIDELVRVRMERQAVVMAMQTFERILGAAMPCAESLTLVRAMEDQWKTRI
jgi:Domain of unknown function (DUF5753)